MNRYERIKSFGQGLAREAKEAYDNRRRQVIADYGYRLKQREKAARLSHIGAESEDSDGYRRPSGRGPDTPTKQSIRQDALEEFKNARSSYQEDLADIPQCISQMHCELQREIAEAISRKSKYIERLRGGVFKGELPPDVDPIIASAIIGGDTPKIFSDFLREGEKRGVETSGVTFIPNAHVINVGSWKNPIQVEVAPSLKVYWDSANSTLWVELEGEVVPPCADPCTGGFPIGDLFGNL